MAADTSARVSSARPELPADPEALPAPVPDSHTHLDVTERVTGLTPDEALTRAAGVGIDRVVQVGCDVAGSRWAVERAAADPRVIAAVAIHPNDAARLGDDLDAALAEIEPLLTAHDRVRAVGETGLDYFRTRDEAGMTLQQRSFVTHIGWAAAHDRTLVIHDRDAHDDIADLLDAEGWPGRVVMHCFSGDADHARRCLDAGAYLSFPGTVTFKANHELREACRITPADRLLVETDAPYLTPVPHRGKPNASYLIPHTVRFLAELRGVDLEQLCHEIAAATDAAFGEW